MTMKPMTTVNVPRKNKKDGSQTSFGKNGPNNTGNHSATLEGTNKDRKEFYLCIIYKDKNIYQPFSVLQAHCLLMEMLFTVDPSIKLIPALVDDPPIKKESKFPSTSEELKKLADSEVKLTNCSISIVKQKVLLSLYANQLNFLNSQVLKYIPSNGTWMSEKTIEEKFLSGIGWFTNVLPGLT